MTRLVALALVWAAVLAARAAVTNVVDVSALVAAANAGVSTTNGWTLSGLVNYTASCVKFKSRGDWLLSPDFGAPIIRVEATVRCSSTTPSRQLRILDGRSDAVLTNFVACEKADTLEDQSIMFASDSSVSCVKLLLDGTGNAGVWGIGSLSIITAGPVGAPTDLRVVRKGDDWCVLGWVNGENTVSNRVDAYQIERGVGEMTLLETAFDEFSAIGKGNPVPHADRLSQIDPALSGVNVYAPTNTSGICQVGKGDALGIIRWAGKGDYSGVSLRMSAKKYPKDNAETTIAFEYNGNTNAIATITLMDEFADYMVDLSKDIDDNDVPGDAALLIGYYTSKSKRRVLIDSMSIVRTNADIAMATGSCWLPASQGPASFSTRGIIDLAPRSECRFAVCAQNADGILSDAATAEALFGGTPGARLILR